MLPPLGLITVALLVLSFFGFSGTNATENNDKALIVVSSYDGTDQNEVNKAVDLYDYLIDVGLGSDDIIFLCANNLSIKDGNPSVSNVEEGFKWLVNNTDSDSDTIIYISDHAHGINSEIYYKFNDGNISISDVEDWVDHMEYSGLAYITTGDRSGLVGSELSGESRVIMSSMAYNETAGIDRFSIARGLENISADLNSDGWVTFIEAFFWEETHVEDCYVQDPQIWII